MNKPVFLEHDESLIDWLAEDIENQQAYLTASIEENYDMPQAILETIRDIAKARGFEKFADEAGLSRKALYKILSPQRESRPRFETMIQLIRALGLKITLAPIEEVVF